MSHIVEDISKCIRPKIENLESLWQQIGYRPEVVEARRSEVLHFFAKLADDMLKEENECKEEITEDISESKAEVEKLCRDLGMPHEKPTLGQNQSLMVVWDAYQEINARLKNMRQQRVDKMKTLYDIENPLCVRLGEPPLSMLKEGDTPQDKQFIDAEKNIHRLRKLLDDRSKEFVRVRNLLLELLADLEVTMTVSFESQSADFQKSVISNDAPTTFILSEINLQKLSAWHADVTKIHTQKRAEVQRLRSEIFSVGRRLNLSEADLAKQTLTSNKTPQSKCSARIVDELTHNLAILNAEKLRQLPLVIEQTRKELRDWFERCWLSDSERRKYNGIMTSSDCTDELLAELDRTVVTLREKRAENEAIYAAADCWVELMLKQQTLDERAADPNRYKNRGGGLLQEEKERKEVAIALPKRERELYTLTADYQNKTGQPFSLCGLSAEEFVSFKKEEYEEEKQKKREMMRGNQAGTSTMMSTAKKQGRQGAPPSASRLITPVTNSTARSNLRSTAKIGVSTPNLAMSALRQHTPLAASTRHLNILSDEQEDETINGGVPKSNRKRTSGQFTVATVSGQQSPAKKRCLEKVPSEVGEAPFQSASKQAKKPAIGTSASSRNLRQNLIGPAPPVPFASPLTASSPSLTNLRAAAGKTGPKPLLGKLKGGDSKSNLGSKNSSRNNKRASNNKKRQQPEAEGYPFAKHIGDGDVGGSVIDFNKLPESFIVGPDGSPMAIFHNASLDPDSGVLAGHSDTTTAELAVDSILIAPVPGNKPQPVEAKQPLTVAQRFAMPPPQLSSTLIAHSTRAATAGNSRR